MNYESTPIVEKNDQGILNLVHTDMAVYDRKNQHIGEVTFVYLGAASPKELELGEGPARDSGQPEVSDNSFVEAVATAFNPEEVPSEVAEKLRRHGYIRIDSNRFLASDRFAAAEQISSVANNEVHLNVDYDQLATTE